jgi:aminopeptidase N
MSIASMCYKVKYNIYYLFQAKAKGISVDVAMVMDTWTQQMGYPVVIVTRQGGKVTARQERFLLNSRGKISQEFNSPFG